MNYAWIRDGVVANISVGVPLGAADTVALGSRPVANGDVYADGTFTRGGEPVLTVEEQLAQALAALTEIEGAIENA